MERFLYERLFTKKQQAELNNYLNTYKIIKSCIKYTDGFINDFWKMYLDNMPIKEIFTKLSYDHVVLGVKRL